MHTIWRNFWLKRPVRDTVIQFVWQNQNHWICITVVLVTFIISFEKCFNCLLPKRSPRGGLLPYKSDGGARRKISRTALKGDRILFHGPVPNSFPPLRGTNSTTINYINGTTNYNSNEDNFKNTFFSRTFMKVLS